MLNDFVLQSDVRKHYLGSSDQNLAKADDLQRGLKLLPRPRPKLLGYHYYCAVSCLCFKSLCQKKEEETNNYFHNEQRCNLELTKKRKVFSTIFILS